eukprot:CAMPEP_0114590036 /NCGR_PEP_ID=MMETSP0125-20121206/12353_1 /TAXON_ID=485358 ORGANISM="Aristerostoma sp., Strain ATCC 50986" /NCGR_SAMPLE_ID=MMETSP0125 /ASSEMBLY_ACC=CAM_ASM_000245 /LENGTH=500 /DNA_ID=CAMNT_0001787259 /DNA_START=543 /DNA_END=2045 /DNA_ORIENTATION=+
MIYYKLTNIDARVPNPDQRMTQDIEKWANSLSNLYSNFTKPVLDIVLFSRKLAEILGWKGPLLQIAWYFVSGVFMRFISPAFGKMTAVQQQLEGKYRACHTDLVHHAEEIAFYRGHPWEIKRVNETFEELIAHDRIIIKNRLFMGVFDNFLTKYGAFLVGYSILGIPVFGSGKEEYLKKVGNDASAITKDYIRNSNLLINLAKAIGRLVISYKEVQLLAGYTSLVFDMKNVLQDISQEKYKFTMANTDLSKKFAGSRETLRLNQGEIIESDFIKFESVPIYTPKGDLLVEEMDFDIRPGMNTIITGPNGCGKSSLFRILGNLWPVMSGKVYKPAPSQIFYVPQFAYLPPGTLRDQIIYPHSKLQMLRRKVNDEDIKQIMKDAFLDYIIDREGGLDSVSDWNDVLSGGERQRIGLARLYYHKPQFAVLDECTSAVSMDVEAKLYEHIKSLGITMFTVSHRPQLFQFHEYLIKLDGEQGYKYQRMSDYQKEVEAEEKNQSTN